MTMTGASSLSRAAQAGRAPPQKGSFEACFAGGLDLSEFSSGSGGGGMSASAALLQIKAKESIVKQQQEQEETRMQEIVQQRTQLLKDSSAAEKEEVVLRAAPPTASQRPTDLMQDNSLFGALVSMHGGDEVNVSRSSRSKMKKDKRLSVSKKSVKASNSAKGRVAKKTKRNKY